MAEPASVRRAPSVTITPKVLPDELMKRNEWYGKQSVRVNCRPRPTVTDPDDALLRVTATCICGSDLHLYNGTMPGMEKGDAMGHEFMGIIEELGENARDTGLRKGQRVVSAFDIGCGKCFYCKKELYSCCGCTNASKEEEQLYGHRTGGFFGYSHLTGGWQGGQAEYVRVPFAKTNLLPITNDSLSDNQVIFLSDILPTAWHANELAEVGKGDIVGIWGAGPVGILAVHCAFHRGASRVILIDEFDYRLEHAQAKVPNGKVETINFRNKDVYTTLLGMTEHGPDCAIEAVGQHYAHTVMHKMEMKLGLENDPSEMLNEIIRSTRKGGRIGLVGVYGGFTNHFNIGGFMEKGMSMRAGQTPCQKYWPYLYQQVEKGALDPTIVITHELPLDLAPHGFKIFNEKEDGCVKVVLKPGLQAPEGQRIECTTTNISGLAPGRVGEAARGAAGQVGEAARRAAGQMSEAARGVGRKVEGLAGDIAEKRSISRPEH